VLALYVPALRGGGNFSIVEITDAVNKYPWPFAGHYIGMLGKFGLALSNPTITSKLRPDDINAFYMKEQAVVRELGRRLKGLGPERTHILLLIWDNYTLTPAGAAEV